MDQDVTLEIQRRFVEMITEIANKPVEPSLVDMAKLAAYALELAQAVQDLDEWLSNGNALPRDWEQNRREQ